MSTALKYYDLATGTWIPFENNVPTPNSSIIIKGTPTGLVNGSNTVFTAPQPYIAGTLQVYINGIAQSLLVAETTPTTGVFTITPAPLTGDDISIYYHVANTAVGNADSIGGYNLTALLQALYPVGAVFVSGQATMPAIITSIGTWVALEGRVIVGKATAGTFATAGATGGTETHTLTVAELPATLPYKNASTNGVILDWAGPANNYGMQAGSGSFGSINGYTVRNYLDATWNGGGAAHNNLQPYKVKYMWERTA
jgi:hypothetical protein